MRGQVAKTCARDGRGVTDRDGQGLGAAIRRADPPHGRFAVRYTGRRGGKMRARAPLLGVCRLTGGQVSGKGTPECAGACGVRGGRHV